MFRFFLCIEILALSGFLTASLLADSHLPERGGDSNYWAIEIWNMAASLAFWLLATSWIVLIGATVYRQLRMGGGLANIAAFRPRGIEAIALLFAPIGLLACLLFGFSV